MRLTKLEALTKTVDVTFIAGQGHISVVTITICIPANCPIRASQIFHSKAHQSSQVLYLRITKILTQSTPS
jgi:hypothetical protein